MIVSVMVQFDVEPLEEDLGEDEFSEREARAAAEEAVYQHLAFTDALNVLPGKDSVAVHVDGFGKCRVTIKDD